MRNLSLTCLSLLFTLVGFAQNPFSYQAVAIDPVTKKPIANQRIAIKLELVNGSNVLYTEEHRDVETSDWGKFSLIVGRGLNATGDFNVNYTSGEIKMVTSIDLSNGTNYVRVGETEILHAPNGSYADRAARSVYADTALYVKGLVLNDDDATNELQVLSRSNDTIFLTQGGFVVLPSTQTVFEKNGTILRSISDYSTTDFVFGSPQLDDDGVLEHRSRMFFDKDKSAFRVGTVTDKSWDEDSIGLLSIASGFNTKATGSYATASGSESEARGNYSYARGNETKASGRFSTAIGRNSVASGFGSCAIGDYCWAKQSNSIAMGTNAIATGVSSVGLGYYVSAIGHFSTAFGSNTYAMGYGSFTAGQNTKAVGRYSTAIGVGTQMNTEGGLAIGTYNDTINRLTSLSSPVLFTIGNGVAINNTTSILSNAFAVYENGNVEINEEYTLPNTDGDSQDVLSTDGNGQVVWRSGSSLSPFDQVNGLIGSKQDTADFIIGSSSMSHSSGLESKLFFDQSKGVLRAGAIDTKDWDQDSSGLYSAAFGIGTKASGEASTAVGNKAVASGDYSIAMGEGTQALGSHSVASGAFTTARGDFSSAIGVGTLAKSNGAFATGRYNDTTSLLNVLASNALFTVGNGTSSFTTGNALTVYENGSIEINQEYMLPNRDGDSLDVLSTDGSGTVYWKSSSAPSPFQEINGVVSALEDTADFIIGSSLLNYSIGSESKLFFDNSKSAFRAGAISTNNWNQDSVGINSFAFGENTKADGKGAIVFGNNSKASGISSIAMGDYSSALGNYSMSTGRASTASGENSISMGLFAKAEEYSSVAIGAYSEATNWYAYALGNLATASDWFSLATGYDTESDGRASTAMGYQTKALGDYSFSQGKSSQALGDYSFAMGEGAISRASYSNTIGRYVISKRIGETIIGKYNDTTIVGSIFSIGNGFNNTSRNTAFYISNVFSTGYFDNGIAPATNNVGGLGTSTRRWTAVYATNGTIQTSDTTLKDNIEPLTYGLDELMKMKTISYTWKNDERKTRKIGFNAQNLLEVIPEVVETHSEHQNEETGEMVYEENQNLGVYYSDIIPVLTKAIQEQQLMIQQLQAEVEALKK